MNRKRLEHLIKVLEAVPPAKFDMEIFGKVNVPQVAVVTADCTTAACALGWAALDPEFQKQGLVPGEIASGKLWSPVCNGGEDPFFRRSGFYAAEMFFDLSPDQRNFLFSPETYAEVFGFCEDQDEFEAEDPDDRWDAFFSEIKPEHVIERVRQLLAAPQAEGEGDGR